MTKHSLKPPSGGLPLPREVSNLHANGSASLSELREFLGGLHGKSPQEVIGIVSSSLLIQSLGIAIGSTVALLFVFTIGPYLIYGPPKLKQVAEKPAAAEQASAPLAGSETAPATPASAAESSGQPAAEAAAKALGIDESKGADPKQNPLDDPKIDNLLDGVE